MKHIYLISFLCLPFLAVAQIPTGYYDAATGLSGLKLKTSLHKIIATKTISWNYGDLPTYYESTDRDLWYEEDSSMLDIYSENPTGFDSYNYYYEIPSLISGASDEGMGWNREHIFSQSFFYSDYPMYSDLHFIVPTDARVNQRRSNLPFANVGSSTTFTSLNGSLVGLSATPGYTLTVFEPIDEFKGDVARMLLYVAVRYETLLPYFQYDNTRSPYEYREEKGLKDWMIPLFKSWNDMDPVSPREVKRNNEIYAVQGNRNPFIDHPEWVNQIWNDATPDVIAPEPPIYLSVENKGRLFISLKWETEPDITIMGYKVYLNDTFVANTRDRNYVFTNLTPGTSYQLKVKAYDQFYNESEYSLTSSVTTPTSDTFSDDLFFTKYIEGSDNNKVLEITNTTGHKVDLRNYTINMRQINGSTGTLYWSDNGYKMEGYLENGKCVVLANPGYELTCLPKDSIDFLTNGTPLTFDGILALELSNNSTTIDRIGDPNNHDPFAVDMSLYRDSTINNGNTTWTLSEWTAYPIDYCEGLGNEYEDTSTAIHNLNHETSFAVYPNPIKDSKVYFEAKALKNIEQVTLLDIKGRILKIYNNPFEKNNYIDLPTLASGIYFIAINNQFQKIVVK